MAHPQPWPQCGHIAQEWAAFRRGFGKPVDPSTEIVDFVTTGSSAGVIDIEDWNWWRENCFRADPNHEGMHLKWTAPDGTVLEAP